MSGETKIDPEAFVSLEVVKEKLEAIEESTDRIEGRLEAIQSSLDALSEKKTCSAS